MKCLNRARHLRTQAGFSIAQLLIYSSVSGFTLAATATTLLSNIRSNSNLEIYQRAQERIGRLSNLIQTETTESEEVLYNQPVSVDCPGVNVTSRSLFTLVVPYLSGTAQSEEVARIHFYRTGSGSTAELRRCGPGYLADGRLNFNGPFRDSRLASETDLTLDATSNAEEIVFAVTVYGSSGTALFDSGSKARVGVNSIDPS